MTRLVTISAAIGHADRMLQAQALGHAAGQFFQPLPQWFAATVLIARGDSYPHMNGGTLWDRGPLMLRAGRIETLEGGA